MITIAMAVQGKTDGISFGSSHAQIEGSSLGIPISSQRRKRNQIVNIEWITLHKTLDRDELLMIFLFEKKRLRMEDKE